MKILNIIQCSNLGGMEKSTLETMIVLKESGHDVAMISLHPVGALETLCKESGISIRGTSKYRLAGLGNIHWLLREIRKFGPDRIWLTGHNFGSLLASRLFGCPTYLSIHFHHCERSIWLWRLFYFLACRMCSGIRFISSYIYEEVKPLLTSHRNVVRFPNIFVEPKTQIDRACSRKQLGISASAYVIGNAGWLIPRKAFDVFLETAALVKTMIPHAVFIVAGDGSERSRLEEMAERLGIIGDVHFLGWQTDLKVFYGSLDVMLFNSRFDALGRTPVEALCYGVPVVASVTSGGLGEFIRSGIDGYLIDHHDPRKLAMEIKRLHDSPDVRDAYVRNGRERVLELGSRERHLHLLTEFMDLK